MKIKIARHDVEITPELKEHIEKRARLALARFSERIEVISVKLVRPKATANDDALRCVIDIVLHKRMRIQTTDRDVFAAVDLALERAARRVARLIEYEIDQGESPRAHS